MALIANLNGEFTYQLPGERGKPGATTFRFRMLSRRQLDQVMSRSGDGRRQIELAVEAVQAGLVGWENLRDIDGQEIEYEEEPCNKLLLGDRTRDSVVRADLVARFFPRQLISLLQGLAGDGIEPNEQDLKN
jgi:hypothetical protein